MEYKHLTAILAAIFIILCIALFMVSGQAKTYNSFCRENGYETAAYVNDKLSCIRINDLNDAEYQNFQCCPPAFTSQTRIIKTKTDYNASEIIGQAVK